MQKNQQKRPYTAPVVTMVDFAVERGFDVSYSYIDNSVELNEALLQGYTDGQLFQEMSMQNRWSTGWGGYSGQASNGYFGYGWSNGDDGFWGH